MSPIKTQADKKGIPRDEKTHDNAHQEFLFTDRPPGF
jgi:hypothetical protein